MTVLEVVSPEDAPAVIRSEASRVLAPHHMTWSDVNCVTRVRPDEPGDGESWLLSLTGTGVRVGARLFSESRWAIAICRTGLYNGESRTIHHINITDRVSGAMA